MAAPMKLKCQDIYLRFLAISRSFSTNVALQDVHNNSKMMHKFLQKKQRKKSHHWIPLRQAPVISQQGEAGKGKIYSDKMNRRMAHINHLFQETASQIVANGELDIYFDITKVKVLPDFSNVNVYWEAKGTDEDVETEKILEQKAKYLRSLMIKSSALGRVPPVTFVKDMTYSRMMEIEHLLKVAESQLSPETNEMEENGESRNASKDIVETRIEPDDIVEISKKSVDSAEIGARLGHGFNSEPLPNEIRKYWSEDIGAKKPLDNENQTDYSEILADKVNLRHDLYGIHHDTLMQKLIEMKSSSRRRQPQLVDLAALKTNNHRTENVQDSNKPMTKKQRAENLKKYTEFFKEKPRKGSRRVEDEMEAFMAMNVTKATKVDTYKDYVYENDTEYGLDGLERFYVNKDQFDDGTDQGYGSENDYDDQDQTENVIENNNDSKSDTDKQS